MASHKVPRFTHAFVIYEGGALPEKYHGQLFGVEPADPVALGATAALVLAVAVLASLAPALRAARVDPAVALRQE